MSSQPVTELEVVGASPQLSVVLGEAQRRVFDQLERGLPSVPKPAKLTWRVVGANADRIEVGMSDASDAVHPVVRREYKVSWLTEPDASGLVHLEVLGDLTAKRTAEAARRVERSFAALEAARDREASD